MRLQFCGPPIEPEDEGENAFKLQIKTAGRSLSKFLGERYRETAWVQCAVDGYAVLLLILVIDVLLNFPIAFRAAYIAPIYFASRRGDPIGQAITLIAVVMVTTAVDLTAGFSNGETKPLNIFFRFLVFGGLNIVIDTIFRRLKQTSHLATHDILTGAANRYAIDLFSQTEFRKATAKDSPLVLVMIDCDDFKTVNDRYGHAYGDQVLVTLVKQLKKSLPADALVGRNGGDEFVVIMPGKTKSDAELLLANAYQRYRDATGVLGEPARFSYGIAELGHDGLDISSLFEAADRDMYNRKPIKHAVVNELEEGILS